MKIIICLQITNHIETLKFTCLCLRYYVVLNNYQRFLDKLGNARNKANDDIRSTDLVVTCNVSCVVKK